MKLKSFVVLLGFVISPFGDPTDAVPLTQIQKRVLEPSGDPFSGGGDLGLTSTDSVDTFGGNGGTQFGGSIGGSSGSSGALDGNLGGPATSGLFGSMAGSELGKVLRNGGRSSDAEIGGAGSGAGPLGGGYGPSTTFGGSPLGAGVGVLSTPLGAGVAGPGGTGPYGDITSRGPAERELGGTPNIGAGSFGGNQPGISTGTGNPPSRNAPMDRDHFDVMAGARSPENGGTARGASVGDNGVGTPNLPERSDNRPGSIGRGSPLEGLVAGRPRNGLRRPSTGFPGGDIPSEGTRDLSVSSGAGLGGLGGGAGEEIGGLGRGPDGFEGRRNRLGGLGSGAVEGIRGLAARPDGFVGGINTLGLGAGAGGSFLGRLRARIRARARARAVARAKARARARARAHARALARARLRAHLRAAFHSNLSIGGGINVGLDKAAEISGDGLLGGGAGVEGDGEAGAGLGGNGDAGAYGRVGSDLHGGAAGYAGSYGGIHDGTYEFYRK